MAGHRPAAGHRLDHRLVAEIELVLDLAHQQLERLGRIGFTVDEQVNYVTQALSSIGLTEQFSRFVLLVGHGSSSENNPYESALDCGACGGSLHGRTTWKNKWRKDGTRIGTAYYVCGAAITKGKTVCQPIQFLQRVLDDFVLDFVAQRIDALLGAGLDDSWTLGFVTGRTPEGLVGLAVSLGVSINTFRVAAMSPDPALQQHHLDHHTRRGLLLLVGAGVLALGVHREPGRRGGARG